MMFKYIDPMKKVYVTITVAICVVALTGFLIYAYNSAKPTSLMRVNPAFREYVQAFTSGIISTHSTIKVRLTDDYADTMELNLPLERQYFTIQPKLKGVTRWIDGRTLEFVPDEPMPQNQVFTVDFYLFELAKVPDSLKTLRFQFQTIQQNIEVEVLNHKAYSMVDMGIEFLSGRLFTADVTSDSLVEKVLSAVQEGEDLPITWFHESKKRVHTFRVDSIKRGRNAASVTLKWEGDPIDAPGVNGETIIPIPALGDFVYLGSKVQSSEEQCIVVQFSDYLAKNQHLNGLFKLGKFTDLRYRVDDNQLTIYLPDADDNRLRLTLESSIKNFNQVELGKRVVEEVIIEKTGPNVRFVGDGNIMPSSNGMLLPFEAVNLKAVDIKVVRIFESNILQFLQVNDFSSTTELVRVGRVVLKKTMPLNGTLNTNQWDRFSIDLSTLIKAEPGAIYTVSLSFKKSYSALECNGSDSLQGQFDDMVRINDPDVDNEKEWSYYGDYFSDDYDNGGWRNYRWEERDNPCKPSYYFNKKISKNIYASDLGILAKAGDGGQWFVAVTDLISTKPLHGVHLEFFNFQLQPIGQALTDGEGIARCVLGKKPFVVVATHKDQKGYLKLTEGSALSLSMFDVSGEVVQKGIKGFIYGERGVWRPGDSLFLTFILEDRTKQLPLNHPVRFSLYSPDGQLVVRLLKTKSVGGFYNFSTQTAPDAPTGNWLAKVQVGNAEFQKMLKIETVKPNRLKIIMNFNGDKLVKDRATTIQLEASWLTGAIARNLKAKVNLTLTRSLTAFPKYLGFIFDNPAASFSAENLTLFEGRLDEFGRARITPSIYVKSTAPGVLKASFETMVFEDGGDFSIDRFSMPYYPFQSYAGLNVPQSTGSDRVLYTDKEYLIGLVNVDPDGNLVQTNKLKFEVFKLNWRWWWDNSESGSADFISASDLTPVDSAVVVTQAGKGVFPFEVDHDNWGRYLIKVTDRRSGHSAAKVVYVDWPGYYRLPGGEKQAAAMLTITADKGRYSVGDRVKLTIPSSMDGRALLTIEKGTTVLKSFWTPTGKGMTEIVFEVTPEMAPNCYAYVTLIQPHSQTQNDLPIRLYGVIPVMVEDKATHLKPILSVHGTFAPGRKEQFSIREANGKPMAYTVAIVDEGLLDLTRFKTPEPWQAFYAREALGVKTWDLYDQVMGAYTGELQRILSIGGDEEGVLKGSLKANRFKPMVRYLGPFLLKAGETKTHSFVMPQYIGSVRVMVVAGENGAYGSTEKTVAVKSPLMVLGTLPRVVGPGETLTLPVTVFAMENRIKDVTVDVAVNEMFNLIGGNTRRVVFSTIGDKMTTFDLGVEEATGVGKVTIVARCGAEKAEHTIEISVRNPNLPVTNLFEKAIPAGADWNTSFTPPGIPGTNKGTLELSTVLPMNLGKRLQFLILYPYGCLEQTTSAVFPQLFLSSMLSLSESEKRAVEKNIVAGIQRVARFQIATGGLSYWPGSTYADDWGTSYAGNFMIEAERQGYLLPLSFLPAWKEFQKQKAISWIYNRNQYNDDLSQAYRLYTLALAKAPEWGSMNRLFETKDLSTAARWMLASAYILAGKKEVAMQLITTAVTTVKPYVESSGTYGSALRDKAIVLNALMLLDMRTKAAPIAKEISTLLCSNDWYGTQSTSYALMALSKYNGMSSFSGISAKYQLNGGVVEAVSVDKGTVVLPLEVKPGKKGVVHVTNSGKGVLHARLIITGIPAYGDTTVSSSNLKITVRYRTMKGEAINPKKMNQGTAFLAEVTVVNPGFLGDYQQLALNQVFPSGWEVINARESELARSHAGSGVYDYQDVRDDRVYTYFGLKPNQAKTFTVMLMAAYQGKFYLPPTTCEAMYDHTINARVPGEWVEVVPAEK